MSSHISRDDLARLATIRKALLSMEGRKRGAPAPRYWRDGRDLELYEEFFGERIAWKWQAVLDELEGRQLTGSAQTVLDWGCGPGVASLAWLGRSERPERLILWDRDAGARAHASSRVRDRHPDVDVVDAARSPEVEVDLLLVSHVLDELDDAGLAGLLEAARRAQRVIWVEPGSRLTSRRLSEARAELAGELEALAPCTHASSCGMLADGMERHWCHFFARPAPEVFTEGRWAEFGREVGVDLRSLPYSFLALARPGAFARSQGSARLLGRPRLQRGKALLDVCNDQGVHDLTLLQRTDKRLFKSLESTAGQAWVLDVEREGDRITRVERR